MVLNQDRRAKFRNWFYGALLPAGSDNCLYRVVGTILHLDSMLERLMPKIGDLHTVDEPLRSYSRLKNKIWKSYRYRAHDESFENILWPEKFSKERLQAIRQDYAEQGYPEGYAQEYLNYPIDDSTAYFRKADFRHTYKISELTEPLTYYSAVDFAISKRDSADYTAIVTVGLNSRGRMYVVDARRGRWDAKEIIDQIFQVHLQYKPDMFIFEKGAIERAIGPFLRDEMMRTGTYVNQNLQTPVLDKMARARSIQARLRQGTVFFPDEEPWYVDLSEEMRTFPKGAHDDLVDAFAWIGLTLDQMAEGPTRAEYEDDLFDEEFGEFDQFSGRSAVTGY